MQPTVTIKRLGWLAAATIVLGVLIGVGAGLLTLLLYGVEHVLLGYIEGPELPGPFGVPAARRAISVTVGLSIAGIIWYLLRHKTTAVPSVKKAVAGKRMPFWQTIAHVVLQIFIVGSGASIGREVAPRELGAMLAQRFCDLFHIEGVDGIEFCDASARSLLSGSGAYDKPSLNGAQGFSRASNKSKGIEGGISTGMPLVVRANVVPSPRIGRSQSSFDMGTLSSCEYRAARYCCCEVPAQAILAEGEAAFALANMYLEKFGCESMSDIHAAVSSYERRLKMSAR